MRPPFGVSCIGSWRAQATNCWKPEMARKRNWLAQRYPDPIHILVSDVMMPGMTGPDLAARLKAVTSRHEDSVRLRIPA